MEDTALLPQHGRSSFLFAPVTCFRWTITTWKLVLLLTTSLLVAFAVVTLAVALPLILSSDSADARMYCYEYVACSSRGCSSTGSSSYLLVESNDHYVYWPAENLFKCIFNGDNCNKTWSDCLTATNEGKRMQFCSDITWATEEYYYAWCYDIDSSITPRSIDCSGVAEFPRPKGSTGSCK